MVRQLLETTSQRAANYLEQLDQRLVRPEAKAVAGLAAFDQPLPSNSTAPEAVLAMMDEIGSPATMAMAGPRFFGFVIGGSLPVTLAANWLASAWDQNSGLYNVTPATARLEQVALRWLIELFELPENCSGAFVTGATVANFTALAAARHAVLERAGWNVEADGTCWCGGTVWQGHTAMRISISSWATTEDDVERSLKAMLRIATSMTG